jgi:hypothetical protein
MQVFDARPGGRQSVFDALPGWHAIISLSST